MKNVTPGMLTDQGICPTCYNRAHNYCLTGDETDKTLFENTLFKCILVHEPRADGHAIIVSQAHYKDMMDIPDELCREVFLFAKKAMNAIRQVYNAESVYLCTMCDGPMNHFHVQLIPRYNFERRGSRNFIKERKPYLDDRAKIDALRAMLA
ncbi:MAG: HIT family protein [Clostridia bacterium]|nr:HIT family protein [Clostridia bacterium]